MPQATVTANRSTWRVGERVSRKDSEELGTVPYLSSPLLVRTQKKNELLTSAAASHHAISIARMKSSNPA
jgi:hypothetical protein